MAWRELETAAPELARLGRERLDRTGLALLGTLRKDGSPRISPVEAHVAGDELLFGVMPWSMKARDLARDPRCVLHSAVWEPDSPEGEFKLYGSGRELEDRELAERARDAWWVGRPRQDARVFSLAVDQAVLVTWDIDRGEMTLRRWSPRRGTSELRRSYP